MEFKKHQIYDFTVKRVELFGGEPYFILAYEGQETMPGYEDDGWVFRVKVYDFQEDNVRDYVGKTMPCCVKDYNKNQWGNFTSFPWLKQDKNYILREKYKEGVNYDFEIAEVPGDTNPEGRYQVRDEFGFKHNLNASGMDYSKGQPVNLRVSRIENEHLYFEGAYVQKMKQKFKVGELYTFIVEEESQTEDSKWNYYTLKEKNGLSENVHRFYFNRAREEGPKDEITLRLKGFSKKGWLILEDTKETLSDEDWARVTLLEDDDTPRQESHYLEYKKSFVFTPEGKCDIDEQLGYEIMRQIAGFLNAEGGELRIGYKDNGEICGINRDLPHINSSNEEKEIQYDLTEDKIKLKFFNTIARKLGNLIAANVNIELFRTPEEKLVCHLRVPKWRNPVWMKGNRLFVRGQNFTRALRETEITEYIRMRINSEHGMVAPDAPASVSAGNPVKVELQPVLKEEDLSTFRPLPQQKPWQYITLYADGSVSKHYKKSDEGDVFMSIPVGAEYKGASARLLLCYDNGHVNSVVPKKIIDNKLKERGMRYKDGFNTSDGVMLLRALVCDKNDYLVIFSRRADGMEMLKAVKVDDYCCSSIKKRVSMDSKGRRVVKSELAVPYDMMIVPAGDKAYISEILSKPLDKYVPGHMANSELCRETMMYLNQRRGLEASQPRQNSGMDTEDEDDKAA